MVRAFAGDSTIRSREPFPFAFDVLVAAFFFAVVFFFVVVFLAIRLSCHPPTRLHQTRSHKFRGASALKMANRNQQRVNSGAPPACLAVQQFRYLSRHFLRISAIGIHHLIGLAVILQSTLQDRPDGL